MIETPWRSFDAIFLLRHVLQNCPSNISLVNECKGKQDTYSEAEFSHGDIVAKTIPFLPNSQSKWLGINVSHICESIMIYRFLAGLAELHLLHYIYYMLTSWHSPIFHITGPLYGNPPVICEFLTQRVSNVCFYGCWLGIAFDTKSRMANWNETPWWPCDVTLMLLRYRTLLWIICHAHVLGDKLYITETTTVVITDFWYIKMMHKICDLIWLSTDQRYPYPSGFLQWHIILTDQWNNPVV